jgi:hypothetical protein
MIEPKHPTLPITRQYELLGVARPSYYSRPEQQHDANLLLIRLIGETHLACTAFDSRQMKR